MTGKKTVPLSRLEDEIGVRWSFLEEEPYPCLVVTARMEFVYVNEAGRGLVSGDWFGKRCFVLLQESDACAWDCPKIEAVHQTQRIHFGEETLVTARGEAMTLAVAVIPLDGVSEDGAAALLCLQPKEAEPGSSLTPIAERLQQQITAHFVSH